LAKIADRDRINLFAFIGFIVTFIGIGCLTALVVPYGSWRPVGGWMPIYVAWMLVFTVVGTVLAIYMFSLEEGVRRS